MNVFTYPHRSRTQDPYFVIPVTADNQAHTGVKPPGPRLNIKTVLSTYGDFHVKDKTAVRTSYL